MRYAAEQGKIRTPNSEHVADVLCYTPYSSVVPLWELVPITQPPIQHYSPFNVIQKEKSVGKRIERETKESKRTS